MRLKVNLKERDERCHVCFMDDVARVQVKLRDVQKVTISDIEPYTGAYATHPTFEPQIFPTAQKYMFGDFTVHEIAVNIVENPTGGNTVYIGR